MNNLSAYLPTALLVGVFVWLVYRNVKRTFGPQPVARGRMILRIVLLAAVGVMFLFLAPSIVSLGAAVIAAGAGVALARYSLLHTTFEETPAGLTYTKNAWIGAAVTALFLGRIAVRTVMTMQTTAAIQSAASTGARPPAVDMGRGPLTNAVFFLMAGYYVAFYVGVLRRSRKSA